MVSICQGTVFFLVALILGATGQPTPEEVAVRGEVTDAHELEEVVEAGPLNSVENIHSEEDTQVAEQERKARDYPEPEEELTDHESSRLHHFYKPHKAFILIKQLIGPLFAAFINAITSVMVNWFWPWKVVPPIPGRVGFGQLFGGFLPKYGPYPSFQFYGGR